MPDDLTLAVVTAAVTGALSIVATYFATRGKIRHELLAQYDKDLRDRRMTAYGALWTLTEPLARYSPPKRLSGEGARSVSEDMRIWYFRNGIVLSKRARETYFKLQGGLTDEKLATGTEPLDEKALKALQDASRDLHTALCGDIGSRKPPMIGSKPRRRDE
jgi:hypothetical protein